MQVTPHKSNDNFFALALRQQFFQPVGFVIRKDLKNIFQPVERVPARLRRAGGDSFELTGS